jgi:hypothetical protein
MLPTPTLSRSPRVLAALRAAPLAALLAACGTGGTARDTPPPPPRTAAPAPAPAPVASRAPAGAWTVDPGGIGPVRTGVTLQALSLALGEPVRAAYDVFDACDHVQPAALPPGVALMVIADTVVRVDVDGVGVRTAEGAQVGDAQARVLALYRGRVRDEPHHYEGPEGRYLIVEVPGDTLHRLVFETDGRRVTSYRAGMRPAVDYVEGCA